MSEILWWGLHDNPSNFQGWLIRFLATVIVWILVEDPLSSNISLS